MSEQGSLLLDLPKIAALLVGASLTGVFTILKRLPLYLGLAICLP